MSTRIKLRAGLLLFEGDTDMEIDRLESRHGVVLRIVANGRHRTMSRESLEEKILSGEVTLYPPEEQKQKLGQGECLSEKAGAEYSRRLRYVRALDRALLSGLSIRSVVTDVIRDVAADIADKTPPGRSTLNEWFRTWRRHGKIDDILKPNYRARGRKKWAFTDEEMEYCEGVIKQDYLQDNPPTKFALIDQDIRPVIESMRTTMADAGRPPTVSTATCYRLFEAIDSYTVAVAQEGRQNADLRFRGTGDGYVAKEPLEYVYEDHQELPIYILLPNGGVIRPWLYAAIDKYSRLPWGLTLSFRPDFASVGAGICHGILGYQELFSTMPLIEKPYPVHGLPHMLVADRGAAFLCSAHEQMCAELGINVIICPPRKPNHKGTVERFFQTVRLGFLKGLPGFVPRVKDTTAETRAAQNACIPFQELQAKLYEWIVDVYARRFHKKIKDYPINKWIEGVKKFPVDLPPGPDAVRMSCAIHAKRILQKGGIEIHGAHYQSEALKKIWRTNGAEPFSVDLKVDPVDIGAIYVKVPNEPRFIEVPTNEPGFRGRDLWLHEAIRAAEVEHEKALIAGSDAAAQARKIRKHLTSFKRKVVRGNDRAHAVAALKTPRRPKAKAPKNTLNPDASTHQEIATLRKSLQDKERDTSKC